MPRLRKPVDARENRPDGDIAHVETLGRELYTVTEAARLLGVQAGKLRRWLDGFVVGDRFYEPVIRPERTGSNTVTWAEFVEAGFLDQYRSRRVSLQHMRPVIKRMREEFQASGRHEKPGARPRVPAGGQFRRGADAGPAQRRSTPVGRAGGRVPGADRLRRTGRRLAHPPARQGLARGHRPGGQLRHPPRCVASAPKSSSSPTPTRVTSGMSLTSGTSPSTRSKQP